MTDKPSHIEQWSGCGLNDPRPRQAKSVFLGEPFSVSPMNALNPAQGKYIGSLKNIPSNK